MEKKSMFIILGVIFLIILGSFFILNSFEGHFNIDGTNFMIPNTYEMEDGNYSVKLIKGNDLIIINKNTSSDINKTIGDYIDSKEEINNTVQISNINVNNTNVYKISVVDTNIVHYWFEKNDKVYEIYTKSANNNTDFVVYDLIKSTDSII